MYEFTGSKHPNYQTCPHLAYIYNDVCEMRNKHVSMKGGAHSYVSSTGSVF